MLCGAAQPAGNQQYDSMCFSCAIANSHNTMYHNTILAIAGITKVSDINYMISHYNYTLYFFLIHLSSSV